MYWAIKELNLDPKLAKQERLFHLQELEEFQFMAYENVKLKLKSRWIGPYIINQVTPHGAIELIGNGGQPFLVNDQRVKHYFSRASKEVIETQDLQCKFIWTQ
ncbi:protein NYNRIN-like [Gossypium australe]|uniref:Protein NYNRIN-like n=1 Tax=Gossypium australe TaxID=47621 RepID=A0A5B6UYQ1_9ROSI|nr:protein NYNRIN-like [Gossypium australe]